MKRVLLVVLFIMLAALTGCTSALSHGSESKDDTHMFLLHIGQITDQVDTEFPDEGAELAAALDARPHQVVDHLAGDAEVEVAIGSP